MVNVTDTVTAFIGLESSNVVIRELIGKHLMRKGRDENNHMPVGIGLTYPYEFISPIGMVSQKGLAQKNLLPTTPYICLPSSNA